jgi:prevent-host-death family protein
MAILSVSDAKRQFSTLLKRAAYGGETITIGSRGRPEAALISVAELSRLRAVDMEHDARELEEVVRTSTSIRGLGELLSATGVAEQAVRMRRGLLPVRRRQGKAAAPGDRCRTIYGLTPG